MKILSIRKQLLKFYLCSFLAVIMTFSANAKSYYFSSSSGNDSNTGTSVSPWKTIGKLNSLWPSIVAGDSILFKCGDVFYGKIIVAKSGTALKPIVISSYGTGANPVITGLTAVTGTWISLGDNNWQSDVIVASSFKTNLVTVNGTPVEMGREPNSNAANGGWGIIGNGTTGLDTIKTDPKVKRIPNANVAGWDGDKELVQKKYHWFTSRDKIKDDITDGSIIVYEPAWNKTKDDKTDSIPSSPGYGYFIQNHPYTLDKSTEWYFDALNHRLLINSIRTPTGISVSTIDTLISTRLNNYITISNLKLEGSNSAAIGMNTTNGQSGKVSNISVLNCYIINSGGNAITGYNADYMFVDGNQIINTQNDAINFAAYGGYCSYNKITNNIIKNVSPFYGMGQSRNTGVGIVSNGHHTYIQYNIISGTGYNGINMHGYADSVMNNFVDSSNLLKDDGAGIYAFPTSNIKGRNYIGNNIILNSIGSSFGTADGIDGGSAQGIYIDDKDSGFAIINNSVKNAQYSCLYLHNSPDITIRRNSFYNTGYIGMLWAHNDYSPETPIRKVIVKENIFLSTISGINKSQIDISTIRNDLDSMGIIDSNTYVSTSQNKFHTTKKVNGANQSMWYSSLKEWKRALGNNDWYSDSLATLADTTLIQYEYNATKAARTISFPGQTKRTVYNQVRTNSVVLAPWTSLILLPYTPPIANAGPDITITLPTDSTTLFGIGTPRVDVPAIFYLITKWTKISGPTTGILRPFGSNIKLTGLVAGTYKFEFKVSDASAEARDTVLVIVNPAPTMMKTNLVSNAPIESYTVEVYPNPVTAASQLNITTLNGKKNNKVSIYILDIYGKTVKKSLPVTFTNKTLVNLNTTSLSNGFYVVRAIFNDGKQVNRTIEINR